MKTITVVQAGLLTSIQDLGRWGFGRFGIPVAGVMDEHATRVLNILLGNDDNAPVLEMTLMGPRLEFDAKLSFAIGGANLQPRLNDRPIELWTVQNAEAGDCLQFAGPLKGCRAYLAVEGGFDVEQIMGSTSTYLQGKLGGYKGRALQKGDVLQCEEQPSCSPKTGVRIPQEFRPTYRHSIRVIIGPQNDAFTARGLDTFLGDEYRVSHEADRMGYRLEGPNIEHKDSADILSDGIALGAIQVPAHGRPIIMLADRQTTGGYTKIANVISVDMPSVAQLKPGEKLTFEEVSMEFAQQRYRERHEHIARLRTCLANKAQTPRRYTVTVDGKVFQVQIQECAR